MASPEELKVMQRLGIPRKMGPIELPIEGINGVGDTLGCGIYAMIGDPHPTSTAYLAFLEGGLVVKYGHHPNHSFLDFREQWKRGWSAWVESAKALEGQAGWAPGERIHLGPRGVRQLGDNQLEVVPFAQVGEGVEPGILMRHLPQEDNLLHLLQNRIGDFGQLVPEAIAMIARTQRPLAVEDGLKYGGARGVYDWIGRGNLNNLRRHPDPDVVRFATDFWAGPKGFGSFVERYGERLDQRAVKGKITWGGGDDKPANLFRVGERVGGIDPIALLIKTGDQGEHILAPWAFRDQLSQVAYFTVYILARQQLVYSDQWVRLQSMYQQALVEYGGHFGEDPQSPQLAPLLALHHGALAQVEYEVNLRQSGSEPDHEKAQEMRVMAQALKTVALNSMYQAHQLAEKHWRGNGG